MERRADLDSAAIDVASDVQARWPCSGEGGKRGAKRTHERARARKKHHVDSVSCVPQTLPDRCILWPAKTRRKDIDAQTAASRHAVTAPQPPSRLSSSHKPNSTFPPSAPAAHPHAPAHTPRRTPVHVNPPLHPRCHASAPPFAGTRQPAGPSLLPAECPLPWLACCARPTR